MVLLESLEIPLGTQMPDFELRDPYGEVFKSDSLYGKKGLLMVFTCNHCPYAKAVWPRLIKLAGYSKDLGIKTVTINPNINPDYPEDAPENMIKKIKDLGIEFPYLVDETQGTARSFKAQCTPDIYLFDKGHKLVYHGRIDDNWQDETKVTREELKEAIENLAHNKPISDPQYPSMGCSIKWR
ncbi:MAG: thioredoxin family protein [Candidatus Hydrothermarchaeales archaeon]